ncbi:MAG: prepilin-type N-terminal cleavage/methylation domain-containing protein [Candidatus Gracilibacteria bacterium]|nr:prepilin-type N-terminal cleavage/methylation domain-containing protein [Candidatus Gracilibacteria bacterium]MDD5179379.1 prepilin-type N-terminal cleavage/methylation domain-containing protein [Candidatus Gracilibacteria bacterium]
MLSKKHLKNRKGFTLIELIVVIVVIGIMSATMLPKIMGAPSRARDAGRIHDLSNLTVALQQYYSDRGAFPDTAGCLNPAGTTAGAADTLLKAGEYFDANTFPKDPDANNVLTVNGNNCTGQYYYQPLTRNGITAQAFALFADVENDGTANITVNTCMGSVASIEDATPCQGSAGTNVDEAAIYMMLGGL